MIHYKLNIGDVATSPTPASYACYGLGSCIGLFIHDRLTGHSAGAHIFLPEDEQGPNRYSRFCNVTYAIEEILRQLRESGSTLQSLRAKIAGGANLFGSSSSVGERNGQSLMKHLIDKKIFIAAHDLGGTYCRTVKFESRTGVLTVSKPQINQYKTY